MNALDIRPDMKAARNRLISLEEIEGAIAAVPQALVPVRGDCLEGAGVMDGGWVAVDFTRFPAPPRHKGSDSQEDLCLCYATFPGTKTPAIMCKAYMGVWGTLQMVGTHYKPAWGERGPRMDCCMEALEIFGVIFAHWAPDGTPLWERDPVRFPDRLETAPTIHGGNARAPIPFTEGMIICPQS